MIICVLTFTFKANYQDDPTKQEYIKREVQEKITNLFKNEADASSTALRNSLRLHMKGMKIAKEKTLSSK